MQIIRRFVVIGLMGGLLSLCGALAVRAANTQDFSIPSFSGHYFLRRDSDGVSIMRVNEKIDALFPDFDQNHGILRALPEVYDGHSLELAVRGVTDDQTRSYNYDTSEDNDNRVLKIGDASTYVHGEQIYNLDYNLRGVIKDLGDHQELYWNVNGTQWQQQFGYVTAQVTLEDGLQHDLLPDRACYEGDSGSKTACIGGGLDGATVTFETGRPLAPGETMSIVLSFKPGTFKPYKPSDALVQQRILQGLGIALPPLLAVVISVLGWRRHGRDDKGKGVIVPQYTPPKDVTVLQSALVLRERFETKAVSATIIDLAVRHYLKIYEVKQAKILKDKITYEVELVKEPSGLSAHEQTVLSLLFADVQVGARVALKTAQSTMYQQVVMLGKAMERQVTDAGYFYIAPSKAVRPYQVVATILFVVSFLFMPWTLGLLVASVILFATSFTMPARTLKGVELREYLLGLKTYMQLAEADRLRELQSPHGQLTQKVDVNDKTQLVSLYEHLLPYAMLFGIEKDWAKELAPLYEQPPDWYAGSGSFNAIYFASAISGFGTATTASFGAPGGSSGSGFSGGAGGGGGGGGGGGW